MSKNIILVLMCHRHKLLDLIKNRGVFLIEVRSCRKFCQDENGMKVFNLHPGET
jgi:hypothetical protein